MRGAALLLVSVGLTWPGVAAAPACEDVDEVMEQITQQQMGQAVGCAQIVLDAGNAKVCDDPTFSDEVCCASCALLHRRLRDQWEGQWQELAEPVSRAQNLLMRGNMRLRSPPLHGRGMGMPLLALGTGGLRGFKAVTVVERALRMGYRHIDTALMYENHEQIRAGLEQSGVPRDEVFLTTKIPPSMMGFKAAGEATARIRAELPGNYADLCLVHWPFSEGAARTPEWQIVERAGTWRAMEEAFDDGTCRAIGVGNYMVKHLEELRSYARVPPSATQMEFSPLAPLEALTAYCRQHGIMIMAFGWRREAVLGHGATQDLARDLGVSTMNAVALWLLQQQHSPIYESSRLERLLEYAEVADEARPPLRPEQVSALAAHAAADYPWGFYAGQNGNPTPWQTTVMGELIWKPSSAVMRLPLWDPLAQGPEVKAVLSA